MWREGYVSGGKTRFFVRALGSPSWDVPDGDAPRDDLIVLLHGWPEDGSSWRLVAPTLVEAGYRVVCPDLKGFGRSDAPRHGYDPETLADEIAQLIRGLHARRAVVVGHDWGGAVALSTAFRHPGRVRALGVASSPFRQVDLRAAWHIPLLNVPLAPQVAFKLAGGPLTRVAIRYSSVVKEPFTPEAMERYVAAVTADPAGWLAYYRTLSRRAVVDGALRRMRRAAPFLRSPDGAHRLRVPAMVLWGEQDRVTPFHLAPKVARDLDATLVGIPGVGHFVHEEAPEIVADTILQLTRAADVAEEAARQRSEEHA